MVLVSAWCWRSNVTGRVTVLTEATRHLHRFRYKYKYKYKYKRVIALIETRRHLLRFSFSLFLHLQQINILVLSSSSTNELLLTLIPSSSTLNLISHSASKIHVDLICSSVSQEANVFPTLRWRYQFTIIALFLSPWVLVWANQKPIWYWFVIWYVSSSKVKIPLLRQS